SYGTEPNFRATADLLIPKTVRKNAPAMLCLSALPSEGESSRFADELAERGYVCLVPGSRILNVRTVPVRRPNGGDYVWECIRGIDLLEVMPEVGAKRIGVIGHGGGGQIALLTAALDDRVA